MSAATTAQTRSRGATILHRRPPFRRLPEKRSRGSLDLALPLGSLRLKQHPPFACDLEPPVYLTIEVAEARPGPNPPLTDRRSSWDRLRRVLLPPVPRVPKL